MSNRQARREQARQTATRPAPGARRAGGGPPRRPTSSGGGPSDILSRPFLLIAGAIVVVLVVILGIVIASSGGGDSEGLASRLETARADLPLDLADGTKLGRDDAPVKITAYEDFQCPFCLNYTAEQEVDIIEEFVKTGRVQIEYQNYPILGAESTRAATAGLCAAEQNKFWEYHNKLFWVQADAGQSDNERLNVGRFSDDKLKEYAVELGLDEAAFETCLNSPDQLAVLTEQQRTAQSFGIRGTPGFLVNGQPIGSGTPADIDAWREIIEQVEGAVASPTAEGSATADATDGATAVAPSASATTAASPSATP